jgi:hypothetical protein
LSVEAGLDLIQHPEVLSGHVMSDALVKQIADRGIVCAMLSNTSCISSLILAMRPSPLTLCSSVCFSSSA